VISQTREGHEAVAELLQQLRLLQEVQITIEASFLRMPKDMAVREVRSGSDRGSESGEVPFVDLSDGFAKLTRPEAHFLKQAVRGLSDASIQNGPKVTVFNGQAASLSLKGDGAGQGGTLQFQAVCSEDLQSVRLGIACGADSDLKKFPVHTIQQGGSIVLDVTKDFTPEMIGMPKREAKVSVLSRIPYLKYAFPTESPGEDQLLLLLTPQIIIQEQEEELLGIDFTP
jgi:hypothetical protein